MTALDQARAVYGASARVTRTPRDTEYDVLARITRNLKAAAQSGSAFADLARAVHDNRALWNLFAADLASAGNGLSPELRGRLLSLAIFVDNHSSKVLRDSGSADVLIEVNSAVMRGLRPAEVRP